MIQTAAQPLSPDWQRRLHALRERVREQAPLVHCLTNQVTMNFVANVLLAAGASPAMTDHPEEAGDLAAVADGVLINLGTPSATSLEAMRRACLAASQADRPWVLDPVGAAALPLRREVSLELMGKHPAMVRGNASEILSLVDVDARGHGVDTQHDSSDAADVASRLLDRTSGVAISGRVDHLVGHRAEDTKPILVSLAGGSAWQPRVTGTGCVLGALIAAYLAVADSTLDAMIAAHAHAAAAAERAEQESKGPGSFAVAWLDALHDIETRGFLASRVTWQAMD